MKQPNIISTSYILVLFIFIFSSCKKGDVGPQGPAGPPYDLTKGWTSKEGFIKGTATASMSSGHSLINDTIDFEGIYPLENSYTVYSPTQTTISVRKLYAGEGTKFYMGEISFSFDVTSLADLSSPTVTNYMVYLQKDLGNGTYVSVYFDQDYEQYYSGTSCSVSNLSYNWTTGILTGNLNLYNNIYDDYGNGPMFFIPDGTFSTKLSQMVLRTGNVE
jgi:hypothetical protein